MKQSYKDQVERIDRLMEIVEANNQYKLVGGLQAIDMIIFACQSMWHLKDWILKDPHFGAKDIEKLKEEIHDSRYLLACSDLANVSKHLSLDRPKIGARLSERVGIHFEPSKCICRKIYYIVSPNPSDEFHGIEVRKFLRCCRDEWRSIINRHYLSNVDELWLKFVYERRRILDP